MNQPNFPIAGIDIDQLIYNADFEETAGNMPERTKICLPDPRHLRGCTMAGHDGSYHAKDGKTFRRHNAFHNHIQRERATDRDRLLNMYGEKGRFQNNKAHVFSQEQFDYQIKSHYVDKQLGALVQRSWLSEGEKRAWEYEGGPTKGSPTIHTSWLQSIARFYDNAQGRSRLVTENELVTEWVGDNTQLLHGPEAGVFQENTYFEMQVNFSKQATPGNRHSWWWMPIVPNTAYDKIMSNGVEIDGYEREKTPNADFSKRCFMKCLGGSVIGNTINELPNPGQKWGHETGAIEIDGLDENKWQTFGLMWEVDEAGKGRLRWFHNGKERCRDGRLCPVDVLMYMILSRECNMGGHALSPENIYDYLDMVQDDKVLTRYVRAWKTKRPKSIDAPIVAPEIVREVDSIADRKGKIEADSVLANTIDELTGIISNLKSIQ